MPKKTKQEKILARLRRLEQVQSSDTSVSPSTEIPKISFKVPSDSQPSVSAMPSVSIQDYSYVYKDLRKSLLFAALATLLQVVLAFFVLK